MANASIISSISPNIKSSKLYNNTLFIGEIKGVNENVKNKHISQLDNHLDDLEYDEVKFTPKSC